MTHLPSRLEEKVAQLFVVGSDTTDLRDEIEPFYRYGLGGILLFRHHTQKFSTAFDLRDHLTEIQASFQGAGLSFVSIDQEGGQVERLPHWLFPTGILPVVFGLKKDVAFCEAVNTEVAHRLKWLGINLNFTPTVDLNREATNPIIGARAYGSTSQLVIPYAKAVIKAHMKAGVIPVAKHFPGHGSGTVDSHLSLPFFEYWDECELEPYQALISANLPAILVAHGLYPKLAKMLCGDSHLPATLSPTICTTLLREKLGFQGLIFTDDLMMGAVCHDNDPVEIALQALTAGADMLVYRRATPEAWRVFEALIHRIQSNKLPEALLDEKVSRILAVKTHVQGILPSTMNETDWSEARCHEIALEWAQKSTIELHHQFKSPFPFSRKTRWSLIAPDRASMIHYQPDALHGKSLLEYCQDYSIPPQVYFSYPINTAEDQGDMAIRLPSDTEVIVFIAFNALRFPQQQHLYEQLKSQHPQSKIVLASTAMPSDRDCLSQPWVHLQLPSYRPAAMQAFVQRLVTSTEVS